jgi:hypothetical protein
MLTEEEARKQLETLHKEGSALVAEFDAEQRERRKLYPKREPKKGSGVLVVTIDRFDKKKRKEREEQVAELLPPETTDFEGRYQSWYSRALPLMKALALDRYVEFQSFYVVDPRYPWGDRNAYVIQDYFRGRESVAGSFEPAEETTRCFKNQLAILKSVSDRLAWSALDSEDQAERGLQLALLETARDLMAIDARSAGAMAGKVLELYLRKLAAKHKLRFRKDRPPTREIVDALHAAKVFDIPVHAQAIWLAEIDQRSRSEGEPPTKPQVRDLIDGSRWLITNIF